MGAHSCLLAVALLLVVAFAGKSSAQLSTNFYSKSCPKLLTTVRSAVKSAVSRERRMAASLLRLHFHDCFVNGCDGSILLDDTPTFTGEQTARPNNRSVRGFEVIDDIKSKVEKVCPGIVSCADILAIAARDSTVLVCRPPIRSYIKQQIPKVCVDLYQSGLQVKGPNWKVRLGRRDSKTASLAAANSGVIPPPTATLNELITRFQARGLSAKDMVALSGSHTIGQARCVTFRARIYNETNINSNFARTRQERCPSAANSGDDRLAPLDVKTAAFFDNKYYKNLVKQKGLLHSDQILFDGGSADSLVRSYSKNPKAFAADFAAAMIKMGNIDPLTGSQGEIRKKCGRPNSSS
ncbi:unnamed protein product [Linum tenue]|uniref:Peroxidase n=1 Tax=Linum tenue TaxID=586396 RepID=A0AAV0IPJ4_9ROSI|nr:unnamed protein product [Linum tenue]